MIGERLYPRIHQIRPDLARKITGMLLFLDDSELVLLLESPEALKAKIDDAIQVLEGQQRKNVSMSKGGSRQQPYNSNTQGSMPSRYNQGLEDLRQQQALMHHEQQALHQDFLDAQAYGHPTGPSIPNAPPNPPSVQGYRQNHHHPPSYQVHAPALPYPRHEQYHQGPPLTYQNPPPIFGTQNNYCLSPEGVSPRINAWTESVKSLNSEQRVEVVRYLYQNLRPLQGLGGGVPPVQRLSNPEEMYEALAAAPSSVRNDHGTQTDDDSFATETTYESEMSDESNYATPIYRNDISDNSSLVSGATSEESSIDEYFSVGQEFVQPVSMQESEQMNPHELPDQGWKSYYLKYLERCASKLREVALPTRYTYSPFQIEDAFRYLEDVKKEFHDRPQVYCEFLTIMKDVRNEEIDISSVTARVSVLFSGKPELILGFNKFLPVEYRITTEEFDLELPDLNGDSMPLDTHETEIPFIPGKEQDSPTEMYDLDDPEDLVSWEPEEKLACYEKADAVGCHGQSNCMKRFVAGLYDFLCYPMKILKVVGVRNYVMILVILATLLSQSYLNTKVLKTISEVQDLNIELDELSLMVAGNNNVAIDKELSEIQDEWIFRGARIGSS